MPTVPTACFIYDLGSAKTEPQIHKHRFHIQPNVFQILDTKVSKQVVGTVLVPSAWLSLVRQVAWWNWTNGISSSQTALLYRHAVCLSTPSCYVLVWFAETSIGSCLCWLFGQCYGHNLPSWYLHKQVGLHVLIKYEDNNSCSLEENCCAQSHPRVLLHRDGHERRHVVGIAKQRIDWKCDCAIQSSSEMCGGASKSISHPNWRPWYDRMV